MIDYKISTLENTCEYLHGDSYSKNVQSNWSSIIAAPNDQQIPLLLNILKNWDGPFGILYVLVASRCGRTGARYQSDITRNYEELELFLYTYQEYFERDGRHHLWIIDVESNNRIIYDNHDLIHVYGDNDHAESCCLDHGLSQNKIIIPTPHSHNYNSQYDSVEDELFKEFSWSEFPLVPEHDDP